MNKKHPQINEAKGINEIEKCFLTMQQLRPHLKKKSLFLKTNSTIPLGIGPYDLSSFVKLFLNKYDSIFLRLP